MQTITVEPLAQEHIQILRLTSTPHLSGGLDTIAPYSVWITYRLNTGANQHTWTAAVSGYRVLRNGVTDMDAASIVLTNLADQDTTPDWLTDLIAKYTPSW
ncbi:hypothetical protein [Streptomyces sp. AcH 505]|uniref:hypothetical protein n=1 Tax=Streptomyces sp. AcH 505 TaxID=352211 RepID=UPI000A4BAAD8